MVVMTMQKCQKHKFIFYVNWSTSRSKKILNWMKPIGKKVNQNANRDMLPSDLTINPNDSNESKHKG